MIPPHIEVGSQAFFIQVKEGEVVIRKGYVNAVSFNPLGEVHYYFSTIDDREIQKVPRKYAFREFEFAAKALPEVADWAKLSS